jgi:hypothetical protein
MKRRTTMDQQYVHIMNTTNSSLDLTALGLILDPRAVSADSFDLADVSKVPDVRKYVSLKLIALVSPEDAKAARIAMAATAAAKPQVGPASNGSTRPAARPGDDDIVFEPVTPPAHVVPAHMVPKAVPAVQTPPSEFVAVSGDTEALVRIEAAVMAIQEQLKHIASLFTDKPTATPVKVKRGRATLPAGQTESEQGSTNAEAPIEDALSPVVAALVPPMRTAEAPVAIPTPSALPVTSLPAVAEMTATAQPKPPVAPPVSRNAELPDDEYIPNEPPAGMHPVNDIVKRFLGYPPYVQAYTPQEKGAYLTKCEDVGILREIAIYARPGKVKDAAKVQLRRALKRMDNEANLGSTVK